MSGNWCLIESDPGVFTEMIGQLGVSSTPSQAVLVEEIIDVTMLPDYKPVLGLIFLFKYDNNNTASASLTPSSSSSNFVSVDPDIFFAQQVIQNACATQAILSILLNTPDSLVQLGDTLTSFKDFTQHFPSDLKGEAISNSDTIRQVHNSFARARPFELDETQLKGEAEDIFHFIAYMPIRGKLYELDGLKEGPICHGECTEDNWTELVQPVIQSRIASYSSSEIRFNLMALVQSKLETWITRRDQIKLLLDTSTDSSITGTLYSEYAELVDKIMYEEERRAGWKKENQRRRANYMGFMYQLLVEMAKKGALVSKAQ